MKVRDFIFSLGPKHITQLPSSRGNARLLTFSRNIRMAYTHKAFNDLSDFLNKGDVIVFNNSKVIPTRFWGYLRNGGQREITLINKSTKGIWSAYIRPETDTTAGSHMDFGNGQMKAKILAQISANMWHLRFSAKDSNVAYFLRRNAKINFPFYLRYDLSTIKRYQTIYARYPGSCQPPTAGLNFTKRLIVKLKNKGVKIVYTTLHISGSILPGNFRTIKDVSIPPEWYRISKKAALNINIAKQNGKNIIAVGTTVVRALESAADKKGRVIPSSAWTDLTIVPGYKFKVINMFLTNFHMPGSSHLLLTCAFGGKTKVLRAYREAVHRHYGFLDFGDSMLIT